MITYLYDILSGVPFWSPEFDVAYREETSATAIGQTFVNHLCSPL